MNTKQDWKSVAVELASSGDISWRSIATEVGVAKSTVSDFLRGELKGYVKPSEKMVLKKPKDLLELPKILLLDIETSSLELQAFSI